MAIDKRAQRIQTMPARQDRYADALQTLVATNKDNRWFLVFGFEKNVRANVSIRELEALQALADDLLKLDSKALDRQVEQEALRKICHEDEN